MRQRAVTLVLISVLACMLPTPLLSTSDCFGEEKTADSPTKVISVPTEGTLYHGVFPAPPGPSEENAIAPEDLKSYTDKVGKPAAWVFFSHDWFRGRKFPVETASWIREAGSVPYVRLKMRSSEEQNVDEPLFTLRALAEGKFDADLRAWAVDARNFADPLLAEYGVEVNGEWFSWNAARNGKGGKAAYGEKSDFDGPELFRDAYRRIIRIARNERAFNITWVFHVNNADIPDEPWNRLELYYPGDEWIDWLAVSAYGAQKPADDEWSPFRDMMDKVYPRLAALSKDKPIIVAEFGCTSGHKTCKQAEWTEKALSDLTGRRWPRVMGFCWWNEAWENDDAPAHNTNMRVQDNPQLARVFRKLVGGNEKVIGRPVLTYRETSRGETAWSSVNDFAYQLQKADLDAIGRTKFDLVVIDYSRDGSEAARFSQKEIAALKDSPGGKKLVLAYMSIGEAEDYRWYWRAEWDADRDGKPDKKAPAWLGPANPDWPGNYKVKYWLPEWQALILGSPESYLDKVIDAGFDGVYLDIIDAFEYWGPDGGSGLDRKTVEREMIEFVKAIAKCARVTRGKAGFGVFPQNGESLAKHADYVECVTGIGKEDLWFVGDKSQPDEGTSESIDFLDVFGTGGKLVLVIEYPRKQELIEEVYSRAKSRGYVPYVTVRALDKLVIHPGREPD